MNPQRPLWRSTPPAIFPVCLGFLALGLGWRSASDVVPVSHEIGDIILGVGSAFFVYYTAFYAIKIMSSPKVLLADMVSAPGRAGIAAGAMSMMMLAAALLPLGLAVPQIWWTGVIMQIGASGLGCLAILREPPEQRGFSPFQYLTFVGPVVGPIAGIELGYIWQSMALTLAALLAYVVITIGYARRLFRQRPPQAMRPKLMIILAPICLFAISFGLLGVDWMFWIFYVASCIAALVLIPMLPWMMKGGWTPVWAAFTFPLAAFLNLQVMAVAKGGGMPALIGIWVMLGIATPLILGIVYRSVLAWVTGELAIKSGAARAMGR